MANRKNTFLIKRSNVAGKVPAAGDLQLGELALNTADNILYASGTTANSILPIGWDRVARTGDTMTGGLFTPNLSATTISATTYLNLPTDVFVTGGTYTSGNAIFTNNTGGTFTVTGFSDGGGSVFTGGTVTGPTVFTSGLSANTISATTYFNLPTDVFVTGGTYTSGNAIFTNNTGGTFTVSGFNVGGGGGQVFYLNLSQSQNGNRLLSTTASTASEQTSGVTIANGVTSTIASFQSQPLNITLLPGGIWSFYLHSYKQNNNASFSIFVEVYKRTSGGTETLLFATDPAPVTTNSPNPSMQLSDGYFSGTSLNVSDSVVAVVRATNTGNQSHTITLVTEGSAHYSYVVSTIPTQQGLTCDTLSGCSIIQTIQTNISNKFDKSGGTVTGETNFTNGLTASTISATTLTTPSFTANTNGLVSTSVNGVYVSPYVTIGAAYTATTANSTIEISGGTFTLALYTAVGNSGRTIYIKNSGSGIVTVDANASQTIDGQLTRPLGTFEDLLLQSNGANWVILNRKPVVMQFAHDSQSVITPADATTYYIGNFVMADPGTTSGATRQVIALSSGWVRSATLMISVAGTLGSAGNSTFSLKNATTGADSIISSTVTHTAVGQLLSFTLATPMLVTKGDLLQINWRTPTWAPNPSSVRQALTILVE